MKRSLVLCFLLSLSALAQNAGKISGVVTDAKTNESLPSVNIVIRGTSLGASTDVDGSYFILNVPPGVYDVAVSLIGYRGVVQKSIIVNTNRTTVVNFSMDETIVQSEEVVVTATRPDVEREKTSTSEIRRSEEVMNVPGIQNITNVLSLSADISDGHFRGGRENEELYNLQGMGIMNPLSSASAFNPIMSAVEEVEIITSGFGAQYGNAQSGIVNITMKEGRSDKWAARAEVRTRAPGQKHFGPSMWAPTEELNPTIKWKGVDTKKYPGLPDTIRNYLLRLDTPEKWLGGDPNNPNGYWGAIGSGYTNRYGKDTATLATLLYTLWRLQAHRDVGKNYDDMMDYSLDANAGGPLTDELRLFLAFHTENSWAILPTAEPNMTRQLMGNIVYDVGSGMNIRLSGAYSREDAHSLAGRTSTGWYNWTWDRMLSVKRTIDENTQLGLRWTHALTKSTFYEIKLNSLQTSSIDGSPVMDPGALDGVSSTLVWADWINLPDGFTYGSLDNDFLTEKTRTMSLDGSITSQVSTSHMLLAGVQANAYEIKVNNATGVDSRAGGSLSQYTARPYEAGLFVQDKMEFEGMIANIGLRFDLYNANVMYYSDIFAPYRYTDENGVQKTDERFAPKSKTPLITRLQPRAGISFPVSVQTVFHVNYGTFLQRPPFGRIISQSVNRKELHNYGGALTVAGTLGNPRLRPEVTSSYDIGVTQGLGEGFTLDVSGYYKDVRDLLQQAIYSSKQGNYVTYINRDYADIRGFRVSIAKRSGILTGTLNYTYGVATGKNSSSDGNQVPTIYESGASKDPVPQDILLDFDRTHNLVANIGFNTPQEWGPMVFDAYPFEQFSITSTSFLRSGRPYTSRLNPGLLMNKRTPNESNTNLKVTKRISRFFGVNASFYVEVSNLFDNRIYDYTSVFNPDPNNSSNLSKWTMKYEEAEALGRDPLDYLKYYEDDLRPGFYINQEFRIFSNLPRAITFGMVVNF